MFALQFLPPDLVERIKLWDDLKRWERREIGQSLRRLGLTYKEDRSGHPGLERDPLGLV